MSISINSFIQEVQDVGVRTQNMFALEINTGLADVDKAFANLTLYAQDFQAPRRGIKYSPLHFRGFPIQIPTNPEIGQEITFQMWADTTGKAQEALRLWQDSIIDMDFKSGSYLGGDRRPNSASTLRLNLLADDMETITESIVLHGVSIKNVGEINFTNNAAEICKFAVTIVFAYPSYERG